MSHLSSLWVISFPAESASPVKQGARTLKRSRAEGVIVMISFFCCNSKTKKAYIRRKKSDSNKSLESKNSKQEEEEEGKETRQIVADKTNSQFINQDMNPSLHKFDSFILQRFVESNSNNNTVVKATWSPSACYINACKNKNNMKTTNHNHKLFPNHRKVRNILSRTFDREG